MHLEWEEVRCQSLHSCSTETRCALRASHGYKDAEVYGTKTHAAGLQTAFGVTSAATFHTCVCTRAKVKGAILTSALSRWEGREPRGIPLVVWENESHLPLTCGGSTFPPPWVGTHNLGRSQNLEAKKPQCKGSGAGWAVDAPYSRESASRCPKSLESPEGDKPAGAQTGRPGHRIAGGRRAPPLRLPRTRPPRRAPKG